HSPPTPADQPRCVLPVEALNDSEVGMLQKLPARQRTRKSWGVVFCDKLMESVVWAHAAPPVPYSSSSGMVRKHRRARTDANSAILDLKLTLRVTSAGTGSERITPALIRAKVTVSRFVPEALAEPLIPAASISASRPATQAPNCQL